METSASFEARSAPLPYPTGDKPSTWAASTPTIQLGLERIEALQDGRRTGPREISRTALLWPDPFPCKCMTRAGVFSFHLEDLSPEWLPEAKRAASSRTMLTIFALIAGLIGAGVGLFFGLASGLRFGLLFGLGGWLFSRWIGRVAEPSPADAMVWSWALAYRGLAFGMGGVLLGVGLVRVGLLTLFWPLCVGLVSRRVRRVIGRLAVRLLSGRVARLIVRPGFWLVVGPGVWLVSGLVRSGLGLRSNLGDLGVALLAGLEYGLLLELNTFSVQKRTTVNGGFKQSALYAAVVLLSCLALAGALAGLMPTASAAPFCGYFCHLRSIPQGRRVLSQASRHALRADSIEVDSGAL